MATLRQLLDVRAHAECPRIAKLLQEIQMSAVDYSGASDSSEIGVLMFVGVTESLGVTLGFAYQTLRKEERHRRASDLAWEAMRESEADYVVVIGRNIDRMGSPNEFLGLMDRATFPGEEETNIS